MKTALWVVLLLFFVVSNAYGDGIILEKPPSPLNFCSGDILKVTFKFKDNGDDLSFVLRKKLNDTEWNTLNINILSKTFVSGGVFYTFILPSSPNIDGLYWLNVKNKSGDSDDATFDVKVVLPPVILGFTPNAPEIGCTNGEVKIQPTLSSTTNNSSYEWWFNNSKVSTMKDYIAKSPGNYVFIVSNAETTKTCSDTSSVKVNYDGTGSSFARIKPLTPKITCANTSIELEAYDTLRVTSFIWTKPNGETKTNSLKIIADRPGDYKLKLSNGNIACDTILMIKVEIDTVRPSLSFNNVQYYICEKQEVNEIVFQVSPSKNYAYVWSNGASTSKVNVETAGTYSITVTNLDNGCTNTKSWIIKKMNPYFTKPIKIDTILLDSSAYVFNVPQMGPTMFSPTMKWEIAEMSNLKLIGGGNTGTGKINIKLSIEDKTIPGSALVTVQPIITDCEGEKDSILIHINPQVKDEPFVPEIITPNGDGKNDDWEISWPSGSTERHVLLYNRTGGKVFESSADDGGFQEIGRLTDGVYFFMLDYKVGNNTKNKSGSLLILHGQ